MQRTIYYAAASVDGFLAKADGDVSWLDPFNSPELGYEAFLSRVGAVVLGRKTFEQAQRFGPWPYPGRLGVVVTGRRSVAGLPDGVRTAALGDLAAVIGALRARSAGLVWIVGGGETAGACLERGLIDELELYVVPVVLGGGIPLFGRGGGSVRSLEMLATRPFSNGVAMLRYRVRVSEARAGDPP